MNEKLNQEKETQLRILYKHKNKTIKEGSLNIYEATFNDILDYFKNNIKKDFPQFKLKSKYFFNGNEIKNNDTILNLMMNQNMKVEEVKQVILEIYLDEIYNLYDEKLPIYQKIIIPHIAKNSLELYTYFPNRGIINIEEYLENIYNKYSLNKINSKTAYCNTINYLFLSGGKYNKEIIDDFWKIDNSIHCVQKRKLPSPKCNHGMFPINNNIILFIGGNDTKSFLFNIEKNEFYLWDNTNHIHLNPSLFLWNNYIYCFSEQNKSLIAERTILTQEEHKWENISLNIINDNQIFNTNNIDLKSENILILRGENNYIYNPSNNNVENIKNKYFENNFNISLNDKNCYKINKDYDIYIPSNFEKEKKLIVLNKKYRNVHKMNFIPSDGKTKIKYQYKEKEIINEENNIVIKPHFEILARDIFNFNNDIEIINDNKNNDNDDKLLKLNKSKKVLKILKPDNKSNEFNDLNIPNEEEIIANQYFTFKESYEENDNKFLHKSKSGLILSESIIFDQLINKQSDLNENPMVNIIDEFNNTGKRNKEDMKIIPKRRNLSADLINSNDYNKNKKILFNVINIENENKKRSEIINEKVRKPKINFLLSKNTLDENLINREIKNASMTQKDENSKISDNVNILSPTRRKLKSSELGSENGENLDSVFSSEAFAINGPENKNDKEIKNSILSEMAYNNKINLLLSQDSINEQLINREIDLHQKKDENDKIVEDKKD